MELSDPTSADRGLPPPRIPIDENDRAEAGRPLKGDPPPAPQFLLWLGLVAFLLGTGVGFVNHFVVQIGLEKLSHWDFGEQAPRLLWWNIPLGYLMGASLAVCGLAMLGRLRVSRSLAFLNLAIAFFATGMAFALIVGASALGTAHSFKNPVYGPVSTTEEVRVPSLFTPFIWPAALVLAALMSAPQVCAWAKRRPLATEAARPGAPTSGLAITSLITSLLPCLIVTPLIGFLCGWAALRAIDRSNGAKSGRWLAICGFVLSAAALFSMAGIGTGVGVIVAVVQTAEFRGGDEKEAQPLFEENLDEEAERTTDPARHDS